MEAMSGSQFGNLLTTIVNSFFCVQNFKFLDLDLDLDYVILILKYFHASSKSIEDLTL